MASICRGGRLYRGGVCPGRRVGWQLTATETLVNIREEFVQANFTSVAHVFRIASSRSKMLSILPPSTEINPGTVGSLLNRMGRLSSPSLRGRSVFTSHRDST